MRQYGDATGSLDTVDGRVADAGARAGAFAMFGHAVLALITIIGLPILIERVRWLTLPLAWASGNALMSVLMLATWLIDSVFGASIIVGLTGVCWALAGCVREYDSD